MQWLLGGRVAYLVVSLMGDAGQDTGLLGPVALKREVAFPWA